MYHSQARLAASSWLAGLLFTYNFPSLSVTSLLHQFITSRQVAMDPSTNHLQHQPNNSSWNHNQHLGVNKLSKPIRKSPLPPPPPPPLPPPFQPQVYYISQSDFREIVQQLTGTSSRDPIPSQPPPPPTNTQAPTLPPHQRPSGQPSQRLQKIRPPPLSPMVRPPPPPPHQNPNQNPTFPSPFSSYMRYLENSLLDTSRHPPVQNGSVPSPVDQQAQDSDVASPPPPEFPSPAFLQSPTAFLNLVSPKSQYPLLSPPGLQYRPQLTRNLEISPGILQPVPGFSQPPIPWPASPLSPGFFLPNSPSGLLSPSFFPIQSPIWRNG